MNVITYLVLAEIQTRLILTGSSLLHFYVSLSHQNSKETNFVSFLAIGPIFISYF